SQTCEASAEYEKQAPPLSGSSAVRIRHAPPQNRVQNANGRSTRLLGCLFVVWAHPVVWSQDLMGRIASIRATLAIIQHDLRPGDVPTIHWALGWAAVSLDPVARTLSTRAGAWGTGD